jgi:hypothetical protein
MFSMRLLMKKLVRFAVFHTKRHQSLKPTTFVSIGYRLGGGVVITDKSRAAIISENCKVLELALLLKLTYRHLRQSF